MAENDRGQFSLYTLCTFRHVTMLFNVGFNLQNSCPRTTSNIFLPFIKLARILNLDMNIGILSIAFRIKRNYLSNLL